VTKEDDVELASQSVGTASPRDGAAAIARDAFEQFVVRSQSMVCAVAYSELRDRALSEEAAQEAFLIAWRTLPSLHEPAALPAWLCGIVRRVAANVRRKRRWEVTTMEVATRTPSAEAGPLDELLTREDEQLAARALAALSEKYREPLVLFYRGEQSVKEVAAALEITEEAAKQRLSRGRKLLKERLGRVERALRATRPGPAFTAATVAAFLAAKTTAAAAAELMPAEMKSAAGVSKVLASKAVLFAVPLGIAILLGAVWTSSRKPGEPRASTPVVAPGVADAPSTVANQSSSSARPLRPERSIAGTSNDAPRGRSSASTGWRASLQQRIDLDFGQASSYNVLRLLSEVTDVPILVRGDIAANVNVRMHDVTAIDALDEVLTQAGAKRAEIPCLRIVSRSASSVPLDGGGPITGSFEATDLREVVRAIEPQLGTPIVIAKDVAPTSVTIRFDSTPAGVALGLLLRQADLGVESAVAFEVTPDSP
jgi:RNA polymerase sigma factor (sigma-70 family)